MPDFPPARAGDAACFADGEIREVVVEHEFLLALTAGIGIELLGIFTGAEGCEGDGLGFAATEER